MGGAETYTARDGVLDVIAAEFKNLAHYSDGEGTYEVFVDPKAAAEVILERLEKSGALDALAKERAAS